MFKQIKPPVVFPHTEDENIPNQTATSYTTPDGFIPAPPKQGMHREEKLTILIIAILFLVGGSWLYLGQIKLEKQLENVNLETEKRTTIFIPDEKGIQVAYPLSQVLLNLTTFQKDGQVIPVKDVVADIVRALEEAGKATGTER